MSHIADFLKSCPEGEDFDELRRNTPGEDGFDASFVGVLHEAWHWDDALYFRMEAAVVRVGQGYRDRDMPRGLILWLFDTYQYVFGALCYHEMACDAFVIDNLDTDACHDRAERVEAVFRAVIAGYPPPLHVLEPPNPLLN